MAARKRTRGAAAAATDTGSPSAQSEAIAAAEAPQTATPGLLPSEDPTAPDFAWWPIERVRPWVDNPRKNARAVPKVADSLRAFGWGRPLVVNDWPGCAGELIIGHTAWLAAHELGLEQVPVRIRRMEPGVAHALALADNKLGEIADWDPDALGRIVGSGELTSAHVEIAGFSEAELRALEGGSSDDAPAPAPPKRPVTKPGDLWLLGAHRLVCGDSTTAEAVALALDGASPYLLVTDPPYGVRARRGRSRPPRFATSGTRPGRSVASSPPRCKPLALSSNPGSFG